MSETQSVEESRVRELQEELSRLKALQDFAGYRYLIEIADAQIKARQDQLILKPLERMDEVLAQEYAKGEISGIRLFRELVGIRITDLEEEITSLLPQEELNDESADSTDDRDLPDLTRG